MLQSGIYLSTAQGTDITTLLSTLPGFTEDYLCQRVETLFLDGLPADDLHQQLFGTEAVIALSSAMPGLAGAIFRKGGAHASLRTETAAPPSEHPKNTHPLTVRLKLFNNIAVERGGQILAQGCVLLASTLGKFLTYRPPLLAAIEKIRLDGNIIRPEALISLLQSEEMIALTIESKHDN